MKSVHIALLSGLTFLHACSPKDPEANLLIGSWNQIESKSPTDPAWQKTDPTRKINVIFKRNGTVSTENSMPFYGGWCNHAERYTVADKTIQFDYGKPNCIPFIDPQVQSAAKILDITAQSLLIDYGGYLLKFRRK
ncbi:hypothetical protein [Spirosoma arcticum]